MPPSSAAESRSAYFAGVGCYLLWGFLPLYFHLLAKLGVTPGTENRSAQGQLLSVIVPRHPDRGNAVAGLVALAVKVAFPLPRKVWSAAPPIHALMPNQPQATSARMSAGTFAPNTP